jgi:hypothetical protein
MAAKLGKSGKVMVSSDAVAMIESWELSLDNPAIETTGLGATARTYVGQGLPAGTGTLTWKALDLEDTATGALNTAFLAGTAVTLTLYETAAKYWGATGAIITSLSQSVNLEGVVVGSMGFTLSGTIAYT